MKKIFIPLLAFLSVSASYAQPPSLLYLKVTPRYLFLHYTDAVKMKCIGVYSNGSTQDLTDQVAWSCDIGTISNDIPLNGLFSINTTYAVMLQKGHTVHITATKGAMVGQTAMSVGDIDGDGVLESDNCPTVPNHNQLDANLDGIGDACSCGPLSPKAGISILSVKQSYSFKYTTQPIIIIPGESVEFFAKPFNSTGTVSYQWFVNNVPVTSISSNNEFSTKSLNNNDVVHCVMQTISCGLASYVKSLPIYFNIYNTNPHIPTTFKQSIGYCGNTGGLVSGKIVEYGAAHPLFPADDEKEHEVRFLSNLTINGKPYVSRYYRITPRTGLTYPESQDAPFLKARITFFYSNTEFVDYNTRAGNTFLKMPTAFGGGNGDPNKANLRMLQKHGVEIASPFVHSRGDETTNPADVDIVYDPVSDIWSVTVDINGFSSFFLYTDPVSVSQPCWQSLSPAGINSFGVKQDGTLWSWGQNDFGHLGTGNNINYNAPNRVGNLAIWKMVSSGMHHAIALKQDGTLWGWGRNPNGEVGDNTFINKSVPVALNTTVTDWIDIEAGAYHTLALRQNGELWAWGYNSWGQVGDNTNINRKTPVPVMPGKKWKVISANGYHSIAIDQNGALWAWGYNTQGELGDGTFNNRNAPVNVTIPANSTWLITSAGNQHNLAVRSDGTLWAWGYNNKGQLGDPLIGAKTNVLKQIGNDNHWKQVSAGVNHSLAIKQDGTLWAWGGNASGQVGNGTTTDINRPVQIGSANTWVSVMAGSYHSMALMQNGSLWSWGDNAWGELGDGTNTNRTAPALISSCSGANIPGVTICNQTWMSKNLDVTTYRNGDPIPQVTDPIQWANLTTGAWCYYNNDPAMGAIYGKLYNWYAVNDPRGLAPVGWHVPSDAEWTTLTNCLGGAAVAGGQMKITGTTNWVAPNTAATNSSGWTGLPGGFRFDNGSFHDMGTYGFWWSSSPNDWSRHLFYTSGIIYRSYFNKRYGFSFRCVMD